MFNLDASLLRRGTEALEKTADALMGIRSEMKAFIEASEVFREAMKDE